MDDWGTGELHVVDACTAKVTKSIPIGAFNQGVLSADGRYLDDDPILGTTISVIDTATESVVRTIEAPPVAWQRRHPVRSSRKPLAVLPGSSSQIDRACHVAPRARAV